MFEKMYWFYINFFLSAHFEDSFQYYEFQNGNEPQDSSGGCGAASFTPKNIIKLWE